MDVIAVSSLTLYVAIPLSLLVGILVGYFIFKVRSDQQQLNERVQALEGQMQGKRHTHATVNGLEQAQAVVIDLTFEAEAMNARIDTLRRYLNVMREGPHAFPIDPPAGRRPAGMDK